MKGNKNKTGIVGYGGYIPRWRIKVEDIAAVWGKDPVAVKKGLLVGEKSVPSMDEDTVTIAVTAARNALRRAGIDPKLIGAVYVGSESHPYAVKPTSTIVGDALEIGHDYTALDTEFACKAGSAAIQVCAGLVKSGFIRYGLAIGADTAQSTPGNALEYTAAAGGAAFIIGHENVLAELEATYSYSSDTPDFWRREGARYPSHGGRFTGEPAYFRHVIEATRGLFEASGLGVNDFDWVVFHQPNAKFPLVAAKKLAIPPEKLDPGMVVRSIGNTYSGSSLLGLAATLDQAKPGQRILVTSYGSGAGSDSFSFLVTEHIKDGRAESAPPIQSYIDDKVYIPYSVYAKHIRKIR